MDKVHRLGIHFGYLAHGRTETRHNLIVIETSVGHGVYSLDYFQTLVFVAASVQGHEQRFGKVAPGTEMLYALAYFLVRHAACDTVVVRTAHRTHQIVVLVLHG